LDEALWDLETAEILLRNGRYNAACFYAHQAAEKAAKALLYSVNEGPWGHSVRLLMERWFSVRGLTPSDEVLRAARELDIHYIPSRYPNAHPAGTPHEAYDESIARRALELAKLIVELARREIPR